MSLQNSYERKIAKNLLCVDPAGSAYTIPTQTALYIGLITDGSLVGGAGLVNMTTEPAMNKWINFDETTSQVVIDASHSATFSGTSYSVLHFEPGPSGPTTTGFGTGGAGIAITGLDSTLSSIPRFAAIKVNSANGYYRIPLDACNISDSGITSTTAQVAFDGVGGPGVAGSIDANISTAFGIDTILNVNSIKFNTATPAGWGNIVGWFITDSADLSATGNIFLMGYTNNNVIINANDRPIFNKNSLSFQIQ